MTAAVLAACAEHYGIMVADMLGPTRRHSVAAARGVACHVLKHRDGLSYGAIMKILERRDHSSVVYSLKLSEKRRKADEHLAELLDALMALPAHSRRTVRIETKPERQLKLNWRTGRVQEQAPRRPRRVPDRFIPEPPRYLKPLNELYADDHDARAREAGTDALLAAMQREGVMAA